MTAFLIFIGHLPSRDGEHTARSDRQQSPDGPTTGLGYTWPVPTYEYECTSCGQHVEVFQRITEDPLSECGVCGGPLRKVFHPAGIVFKGSGFYATDSRSKRSTTATPKSESTSTEASSAKDTSGSKDTPSPSKEKGA
jgi:putative FmdB family regulatory protein